MDKGCINMSRNQRESRQVTQFVQELPAPRHRQILLQI